MRSVCSPLWDPQHKTLRDQLIKQATREVDKVEPQAATGKKMRPQKRRFPSSHKQGRWSNPQTTLCPGMPMAQPYLPLGVEDKVTLNQQHRLQEQVRTPQQAHIKTAESYFNTFYPSPIGLQQASLPNSSSRVAVTVSIINPWCIWQSSTRSSSW